MKETFKNCSKLVIKIADGSTATPSALLKGISKHNKQQEKL
tara:strand:- start:80 stop:202 length:123 start_codon:yes stop_codon:yes gene_type:complete